MLLFGAGMYDIRQSSVPSRLVPVDGFQQCNCIPRRGASLFLAIMLKLAEITGNASDEIKKKLDPVKVFSGIRVGKPVFGDKITECLQVTEVSVVPMKEEPSRSEGRVVCHLVVTEGIVTVMSVMHRSRFDL